MKHLMYALRKEWFNILLLLIPFVLIPFIWNDVPSQIATQWNFDGEPSGYSNKPVGLLLIPALNAGIYFLLLYLPVIDPKNRIEVDQKPMPVIRTLLVVLLLGIHGFVIMNAMGLEMNVQNILMPALALFFVIMGNYLRTIKPNYFIGIRVPWALEDADNWRKTHELGSVIWVAGGLLLLLLYPFVNSDAYSSLFFVVVMIMALVPTAYSFYLYKMDGKS